MHAGRRTAPTAQPPWNRRARPARRPRPKPRRRLPPEVLTDAEVRALMAACPGTASGLRNRALIVLMYRSGLRIREALDLRPKDLDLSAGAVAVLNGKGGRSRVAGIDPAAGAVLREWLALRAALGLNGLHPVFCSLTGGRLTAAYTRRLLPALGRRAGVEKRVHAHGLRHTHAAQLREEGVDIGIISKQLGTGRSRPPPGTWTTSRRWRWWRRSGHGAGSAARTAGRGLRCAPLPKKMGESRRRQPAEEGPLMLRWRLFPLGWLGLLGLLGLLGFIDGRLGYLGFLGFLGFLGVRRGPAPSPPSQS